MAFLKSKWRVIVFSLACLASIGGAAWAYVAGSDVDEQLAVVDRLTEDVRRLQARAANSNTIQQRREQVEAWNTQLARALDVARDMQRYNRFYEEVDAVGDVKRVLRKPLIENLLPAPQRAADAIRFKNEYKRTFPLLNERLRARDKPSPREILEATSVIESLKQPESPDVGDYFGGPPSPSEPSPQQGRKKKKNRSRAELLREYAKARAAEKVASSISMYVDDRAFGKHGLVEKDVAPTAAEIWQAQMSLWIQQDIAAALASCNDEREAALVKQGREDDLWVAHMPVKRLKVMSIDDRLGKGGGSNTPNDGFATSFTGVKNDKSLFVVPLQLVLIVEEAALPAILAKICQAGFYTPINVSYKAVPANPLQEDYLYGDDPVVEVTLDLEGYFFHQVFGAWIPKDIKKILQTPGAVDKKMFGRGRR